eukprot:290673-Chlamydomonas_euryale.AAC.2
MSRRTACGGAASRRCGAHARGPRLSPSLENSLPGRVANLGGTTRSSLSRAALPHSALYPSTAVSSPPLLPLPAGSNRHGQLGVPGATQLSEPKLIQGAGRWATLAFSSGHAAGLTGSGQLYTWGRNSFGQLGQAQQDECIDVPSKVEAVQTLEFRWATARIAGAAARAA